MLNPAWPLFTVGSIAKRFAAISKSFEGAEQQMLSGPLSLLPYLSYL